MTDIVDRLRKASIEFREKVWGEYDSKLTAEAADEIERLRAELADWQRTVRAYEGVVDLADDPPDYLAARGVVRGGERAETIIRRIRGG